MTTEDDIRRELEEEHQRRLSRFRILVCIDGSDESYRAVKYAALMGGHRDDCDIILLYVRPIDQGMHTGGLQVRVARENILNWGLELPGIRYLNKGLEILMAEEDMKADEWNLETTHTDVVGDPLGDNKTEYRHPTSGRSIVLKLKVAPDAASGILDQFELGPYDVIILGCGKTGRSRLQSTLMPSVSEKVALHAPCTVLVARDLIFGHGHLVCVNGTEKSMEMAKHESQIVARFRQGHVTAIQVVETDADVPAAEAFLDSVDEAMKAEFELGLDDKIVRVGRVVQNIVDVGKDFTAIVIAGSSKSTLQRMFIRSVPLEVLRRARNSVMIVR